MESHGTFLETKTCFDAAVLNSTLDSLHPLPSLELLFQSLFVSFLPLLLCPFMSVSSPRLPVFYLLSAFPLWLTVLHTVPIMSSHAAYIFERATAVSEKGQG